MNQINLIEETPAEETPKERRSESKKETEQPTARQEFWFTREEAYRWLPFTLFLFIVVLFYISVQQYAERTVRQTEKLNREIKELRSEYLSTKAELMQESMQTDLAKKLEHTGLKELRSPAMSLNLESKK